MSNKGKESREALAQVAKKVKIQPSWINFDLKKKNY
jgi:hypothetical protein